MNRDVRRTAATLLAMVALVAATVASALVSACEPAIENVVYKVSGGGEQVMEVHFPPGHDPARSKAPAVILFHGGGWGGGDRKQMRRACEHFAREGLVAASANYRMLTTAEVEALPRGESRKRACVTDAKSAIRWIKAHAGELGIDRQRIVAGGSSAGGHIATLATLNTGGLDDPADPAGVDTRVRGLLLFNPAFVEPGKDRDSEVDVFEHLDGELPPFLFLFGSEDHWKPASDGLVEALRQQKATVTYFLAPNEKHSFWGREPWLGQCLAQCDAQLASWGLLDDPAPAPPVSSGKRLTEIK